MTQTPHPTIRPDEFQALACIVSAALDAGHRVSVFDGEEWVVKFSTNRAKILKACGSTEEDTLRIRDALGNRVGSVTLVYGNEPGVLISDHTDNEAMDALLADANAVQDALQG